MQRPEVQTEDCKKYAIRSDITANTSIIKSEQYHSKQYAPDQATIIKITAKSSANMVRMKTSTLEQNKQVEHLCKLGKYGQSSSTGETQANENIK